MTLFFHLKAGTERKFRETAMKKYGYSKGALKSGLEEAIEDWLKKHEAYLPEENTSSSKTNEDKKEK